MSLPSEGVRAPSAMVSGTAMATRRFWTNDCVASSPAAGSTPITLHFGARCLAAIAQPESSPPPPQGTSSTSSGPASSMSSFAAVPWPAMMCGWSNGGINVSLRSAASLPASVSRSSCFVYCTTSAP